MGNRFDDKYDIRLAKYDEIPMIMEFIDTYWRKGHILAVNRDFFEYEMVVDGKVNFLIARTLDTGVIEGVLGFLPCSEDKEKLDIWGVIWKTIPGAMPMLGMELKKRLMLITGARTDLGVGANSGTSVPLLGRIYHYYTARMKHYYRLADRKDYSIAKVDNPLIPSYKNINPIEVSELKKADELKAFYDFSKEPQTLPYKDFWYYNKRFYKHPIYSYCVWGLERGNDRAVIVTRKQVCNGNSAIRIVDFIGKEDILADAGSFFDSFLKENEYIDFYFDGIDENLLKEAGMLSTDDSSNIIPDYFNPYEQTNVDIYVDCSNKDRRSLFFKADGDQDRPN